MCKIKIQNGKIQKVNHVTAEQDYGHRGILTYLWGEEQTGIEPTEVILPAAIKIPRVYIL